MLADQGFEFAIYFGVHGSILQTPNFMRAKWQLSLKEVVVSKKKLTEGHIHVERMIGLLKTNTYTKYYKVISHFV